MTNRQRIEIKMSELRTQINGNLEADGESEALQNAMNEYKDMEIRLQAAIMAEQAEAEATPSNDGEGREIRSLLDKASVGAFMLEAAQGQPSRRRGIRTPNRATRQRCGRGYVADRTACRT